MSDAPAKDSLPSPPPAASVSASITSSSSGGGAPASAAAKAAPAPDVVLIGPPTDDGAGVHVIRAREERLEAGELRPLQEGRPITGEIVTLAPRKDQPRVFDVQDSYRPPTTMSALSHKGPANVSTDAYRDGWDEVFGKKPSAPPGAAN